MRFGASSGVKRGVGTTSESGGDGAEPERRRSRRLRRTATTAAEVDAVIAEIERLRD
jgi:hypothetical protein